MDADNVISLSASLDKYNICVRSISVRIFAKWIIANNNNNNNNNKIHSERFFR
jgi:hypothetical protein